MDGTITALAAATAALVAFALVALMFWKGRWLFLVAGRAAAKAADDAAGLGGAAGAPRAGAEDRFAGDVRKMGRRMAVVLLAGCALVATLLAFEAAKLAGNAALASAATLANNVAFVALLAAMAWFFIVQRPERPKEDASPQGSRAHAARLDHLPFATILFALAFIAVVALVGILCAGI